MSADLLIAAGRVLLAGVFVVGGIRHFGALPPITEALRARGVPFPRAALIGASLFQIGAGLLLAAGLFVFWAAIGLIGFTLVAGYLLVNFWNQQGEARAASINIWMSNLALIGGLLVAAAAEL